MATPSPPTTDKTRSSAPRRSLGRRIGRWLLLLVGVLAVVLLVAGLWLHHRIAASLPVLRGQVAMPTLSAPVAVERDALGVPTLRAATRLDAARGLGFVHAQDRFFQMDMLRREAAGESFPVFVSPSLRAVPEPARSTCRAP